MANYKELLAQREQLEKQIEEAMCAERAAAIVSVRTLVAEFGLTAAECGCAVTRTPAQKVSEKGKRAVAAKYSGPNGEIWTGRGRTPKWLAALEAQGQPRGRYLVA